MKDIDVINAFFARPDLVEHEQLIKQKCIALKQKIDAMSEDIKTKRSELFHKEDELKAASSQFDVLLQLVLEQEKARLAKSEPVAQEG